MATKAQAEARVAELEHHLEEMLTVTEPLLPGQDAANHLRRRQAELEPIHQAATAVLEGKADGT